MLSVKFPFSHNSREKSEQEVVPKSISVHIPLLIAKLWCGLGFRMKPTARFSLWNSAALLKHPTHPAHYYDNLVLDVFGKHGNSFIDGLVASVVHKHSANRHRLDWVFFFFVFLSLKWMLMQFAAMCSPSSHCKQSVSCGHAPLCVEEVGDVSLSALLLVSNKHEPFFWLFFPLPMTTRDTLLLRGVLICF